MDTENTPIIRTGAKCDEEGRFLCVAFSAAKRERFLCHVGAAPSENKKSIFYVILNDYPYVILKAVKNLSLRSFAYAQDYSNAAQDDNDVAQDYSHAAQDDNDVAQDYNEAAQDYNEAAQDYNEAAQDYSHAVQDDNEEQGHIQNKDMTPIGLAG